ncbi:MAG: hypothetical protein V4717_04220 [Bacteroidota bacterium]
MKKIFIYSAFAFSALTSCQKDLTEDTTQRQLSAAENLTTKAADPTMLHLRVDVTGLTFHNDCTNEEMLILSGIFFLNSHRDGTIASTNVHNFVLQAADGTIYRGVWVNTFQVTAPLPDPGAFNNTYKVILTTSGGGNNSRLTGVFHITQNANGEFTSVIDNFTAGCQ